MLSVKRKSQYDSDITLGTSNIHLMIYFYAESIARPTGPTNNLLIIINNSNSHNHHNRRTKRYLNKIQL